MRPWREDNPPYYLSAYGIACKLGFKGTQEQWLTSLTAYGVACTNGYQGTQEEWLTSLTAYGVACTNGFQGTQEEWLESMTVYGLAKQNGYIGTLEEWLVSITAYGEAMKQGFRGTAAEWLTSLTAYGVACSNGFQGTQTDWLLSMTAYGVACTNGYQGTVEEWLVSITAYGEAVKQGFRGTPAEWLTSLTAYGVACTNGYQGTQEEWLESLKGEKGDSVTLVNSVTEYQVGDSGKDVPTGEWTQTIPETPQGKYLWARVTKHFNSGEPEVYYSVSRMGIDGSGSVISVCGKDPDVSGNVTLGVGDIGALDMKLAAVTLLAAGWADGAQTVAADGVTADDTMTAIITTAAAGSVDAYLDSGIKSAGQGEGTLTFSCTSVPDSDITVNLIILKKGGWAE